MQIPIEVLPYLVLGACTGVYGILVGAGGGIILAPALMIIFGVEPAIAAGTSLALVAVNSVSGTIAYKATGYIDSRSGILFAVAAIPGSIIAPIMLDMVATNLFKLLFGILLILLAVLIGLKPNYREIENPNEFADQHFDVGRSKIPLPSWLQIGVVDRHIQTSNGQRFFFRFSEPLTIGLNLVLGFVSSFFGTGGGFLRTPVLVSFFGFPVQIAVATSIFALSVYSIVGSVIHGYLGNVDWYPAFVWCGIGLIMGGQLGARLLEVVKGVWILRILLLVVVLMGVQLLLQAINPELFSLLEFK